MSDPLPPVTAAVTPAPLPEGFTVPALAALARDLAIGMYEEQVLLKKNGVTPEQYATLKSIPYFQKLVEQMAIEWNAPKSVQQRLAIETAVGLEEVLPDVIARAKIKNEPLQGVAQLLKVLADIAGANANTRAPAAPTEKFKITINLGADTEVYEKTKPVVTIEQASEVPALAEGLGSLCSIQTEPEKA